MGLLTLSFWRPLALVFGKKTEVDGSPGLALWLKAEVEDKIKSQLKTLFLLNL
jgi:hypothetical protein